MSLKTSWVHMSFGDFEPFTRTREYLQIETIIYLLHFCVVCLCFRLECGSSQRLLSSDFQFFSDEQPGSMGDSHIHFSKSFILYLIRPRRQVLTTTFLAKSREAVYLADGRFRTLLCRKFGSPYLGKAAAGARVALRSPIGVCGLLVSTYCDAREIVY